MAVKDTVEKLNIAITNLINEADILVSDKDALDVKEKTLVAKEQVLKDLQDKITEKLREDKRLFEQAQSERRDADMRLKELDEKAPRMEKRYIELIEKEEHVKKLIADLATTQDRYNTLAKKESELKEKQTIFEKEREAADIRKFLLDAKEKDLVQRASNLQAVTEQLSSPAV